MTDLQILHDELASQWAFTHCLACRGQAWLSPAGEVFCGSCEERAERLAAVLASVARPPVFERLKSALLKETPA